jgi:uncharacterized protein (TIGR00369 family)
MRDHLEPLATRLETSPYNAALGVRVEQLEPDRARIRVPYRDENANPGRALHGGVPASAINIAGAAAAWTQGPGGGEVEAGTLDLSVSYLAAAIGEDIVVSAEVLRRGKEIVYVDADVRNDAGKRIAKGLVTYRMLDLAAVPAAHERQRGLTAPALEPAAELLRGARGFMMVPFIARLGMELERARDGYAAVRLPGKTENLDHDRALHEGAVAALVDTTGALASWSVVGLNLAYKASTVGIHVSHHTSLRGEDALAQARTMRRNNEIFLNQVTVSGLTSGRVVATGSVTYRIVVP